MLMQFIRNPLLLVINLVTVIIALSFHEFAHAFAAYKMGDPTAKNMGRMSLDPLRHMDLMGFICMLLFRFGWAKPVPVNPNNFKNRNVGEIVVSLAGITMNFLLAFATIFIAFLLTRFFSITNETFWVFVQYLALINLSLMVFNLLPIPPLDGYQFAKNLLIGKVRPQFFWEYERIGNIILIALILLGALSGLIGTVVSALYNGITAFCYMLLF